MIEIYDGLGRAFDKLLKRVYRAAMKHFDQRDIFSVELGFVPKEEMQALNLEARGVDSVTDVLSFPALEGIELPVTKADFEPSDKDARGRVLLGEIVICPERMREQAEEYGHGEIRECAFLFLHGLLHLLGYDHIDEEEREKMFLIQEEILNALGICR